jgi:hypothetical protein
VRKEPHRARGRFSEAPEGLLENIHERHRSRRLLRENGLGQ